MSGSHNVLSLLALIVLPGCLVSEFGSGNVATEVRDADGATAFHLANFVDTTVEVQADEAATLTLSCDDNLLDALITEVEDGVLVLRTALGHRLVPRADCTATVVVPTLTRLVGSGSGSLDLVTDAPGLARISVSGSGKLTALGTLTDVASIDSTGSGALELGAVGACDLDLGHSGSGRVRVHALQSCTAVVTASGSGRTSLAGEVDQLDLTLTGSGGFGEFELVVTEANILGSGSGDIELTVTDAVDVTLTGSGDATIRGNPAQHEQRETGSGRVHLQ